MWSNTTSHPVKRLHTDNGGEYVILELQSFLREQCYSTRVWIDFGLGLGLGQE